MSWEPIMDASATNETLAFEGWRFQPRTGHLLRENTAGDWTQIRLSHRALDILARLLEQPGALISKDSILDTVWPDVVVAPNNLTVQMATLRRVLDEGRAGDSCIQTVPGRGYRFVLPVTRIGSGPIDAEEPAPPECSAVSPGVQTSRRPWLRAGSTVIAFFTLIVGLWWLNRIEKWRIPTWGDVASIVNSAESAQKRTPPFSLAIVPFDNLSGNGAEDYIADSITDDINSDLSRVRGMCVLARSAATVLKGKSIDPRDVGKALQVRYLLEGSVRKIDDIARVNVRLVDANSGRDIWADHFDQSLKDLGAGEDAIVRRIGAALRTRLVDIENARNRQERPTNPNASDLIVRANSISDHPHGATGQNQAIALLEKALLLNPNSVQAMADLAFHLLDRYNDATDIERAADLLSHAAAISPDNENVLSFTGVLYELEGRDVEALTKFQRLLQIDPNLPMAYNNMSRALIHLGRFDDAVSAVKEADRLDPAGAYAFARYHNLELAYLLLGSNEEAILWGRRALAANPNLRPDWRAWWMLQMAAAETRLGHQDEARQLVTEATSISPYITARQFLQGSFSSALYKERTKEFADTIRLAGVRDHADEDADFGVKADGQLTRQLVGPTPMAAPGVMTIRTKDLAQMLEAAHALLIDTMMYLPNQSIQGAVGLFGAGSGGSYTDQIQNRLRQKMRDLTGGDYTRPVVAVGWNAERFNGYNLALRLKALGYTQVYWYRGGREAWETQGQKETEIAPQTW
jgi:adenylate cyclase